jgi:hypothetical protein
MAAAFSASRNGHDLPPFRRLATECGISMQVKTNCIENNIPIQYRILLESRVAKLATTIGFDFTMVFSPDVAECAPC